MFKVQHSNVATVVTAIVLFLGALALMPAHEGLAHANIVRESPAENALLGAPPRTIELWTTEQIAVGAGSPALRVLDEDGSAAGITVSNVEVDPNDPQHLRADVEGIGSGTYTVVWTIRSDVDGHTLNGSYAFRVAGTARAPGAAAVEGETPRTWAVTTRWLTFLGAGIASAGFLAGLLLTLGGSIASVRRRRFWSILLGGGIALVATLAEPLLQTRFPAMGAASPSLGDALASLPLAWWFRPVGLGLGIVVSIMLWRLSRDDHRIAPPLQVAGAAVMLVALLGLALTSHASARDDWRVIAIPSIVLHQWSVALWVGGLAQLALIWPWGRPRDTEVESEPIDPVRQFSRYALVLAAVGIGTGVVNAGLVLPTLRSLWSSDYGGVILGKVAILVPVLALASFHRLSLHRSAVRVGASLRRTVRIEAALILLVVLGGSILAMLAPPTIARGTVDVIELASPTGNGLRADDLIVHLEFAPGKPGENRLTVRVNDSAGRPVPTDQIALVRLNLTSLDHDAEQPDVEMTADGSDGFSTEGVQLSLSDWWRIEVLVRRLGREDATAPFYLRLPDPNLNGFDVDRASGSDEAQAAFDRALDTLLTTTSIRWTQQLGDGAGIFLISYFAVRGKEGDAPAGSTNTTYQFIPLDRQANLPATPTPAADGARTPSFEQIVLGTNRWQRQNGGLWLEGNAAPVFLPSEWGANYEGATDLQLGRREEIDGVMTQVLSFVVPGERVATAYYAWWIELETGHVLRETMVSRSHYMVYNYYAINEPITIEPPVDP